MPGLRGREASLARRSRSWLLHKPAVMAPIVGTTNLTISKKQWRSGRETIRRGSRSTRGAIRASSHCRIRDSHDFERMLRVGARNLLTASPELALCFLITSTC